MFEGDHSNRSAEKQKAQNPLGNLLTITLITHLVTLLIWTPRERRHLSHSQGFVSFTLQAHSHKYN